MKKILFLSTIFVFAFIFVSCGHSHAAGKEYKSDENYHWYPCVDGDCEEQLEKAAHNWGEGEVTTKPTSTNEGVISYLCIVCKKLKQEPVKYTPTLSVTKEQWQNAFSIDKFQNVTAQIIEEIKSGDTANKRIYEIEADKSVIYVEVSEYKNSKETGYYAKFQDGMFLWTLTSRDQTIEDARMEFTGDTMKPTAILTDYGFEKLESLFALFIYNEDSKCYEATNVTIPETSHKYKRISVKLSDGQVTEIMATTADSPEKAIKIIYSSYGTTKPTPPTAQSE